MEALKKLKEDITTGSGFKTAGGLPGHIRKKLTDEQSSPFDALRWLRAFGSRTGDRPPSGGL